MKHLPSRPMLMQGTEAKTTPKPATAAAPTDAPSIEGAEAIDSTVRDAATSVERHVIDWIGVASDWLDGRPIASHVAGIAVLFAAATIA
ncbi:MAG: hypothetical protein ACO38P_11145, partial [Phycisphaerales bacterium]